jgi:hypothetical protein
VTSVKARYKKITEAAIHSWTEKKRSWEELIPQSLPQFPFSRSITPPASSLHRERSIIIKIMAVKYFHTECWDWVWFDSSSYYCLLQMNFVL